MSGQPKSHFSLESRIAAAAMGTAVGVLLLACALFTLEQWSADRAHIVQAQARVAATLSPGLETALRDQDMPRLRRIIGDAAMSPRLIDAEVRSTDGRTLVLFYNPMMHNEPHGALLKSSTPLKVDGRVVGVLAVESGLEAPGRFLPRYVAVTGALFFAAIACSLFLGRVLALRVVQPINRLSSAMGELAVSGNLARRVKPAEDAEFARLIDSFNTLLDRLQANENALRGTMNELVAARDQAEAANVQKSYFLANMSHEIRTPLNGVLAMAQIMALGDLGPEQKGRLDVIRNSGEALLTILNDILDVSKIEAGALELESIPFDVEPLFTGAVGSFSAIAEGKGLALLIEVDPAVGPRRVGDPARLRQIVSNLVSNALKFTDEGRVTARLEAYGEGADEGLRLVVSDTGIGMPKDKLSLLFQKFTQLDASTTRRFGGTGLGLSICRELSKMMGGRIWAESEEGVGSTFFVEVPFQRAPDVSGTSSNDQEALHENEAPLRVLAAEDNRTNQLVLSTILEIFGAELEIVENGLEAVEACCRNVYDVILMDIQMPVMDGIAAAREIRRQEIAQKRQRVPIIAVSANAMANQVEEYIAAGMDCHVAKPIEITKLQFALEDVLSNPQEIREPAAA